MSNRIHPTAIVDESAILESGVVIGPYCVIGPNVLIKKNTKVWSHAVIGTSAEHKSFFISEPGIVEIGKDCIIREFVTINASTDQITSVDDNCILLRGSHVGHDAVIEKGVTLSCNVLIGGHARVFKGANLGLASVVHQWCGVGHYAMVGMNSTVTKKTKIEPMKKYVGSPARLIGENNKHGFSKFDQKHFLEEMNNWQKERIKI